MTRRELEQAQADVAAAQRRLLEAEQRYWRISKGVLPRATGIPFFMQGVLLGGVPAVLFSLPAVAPTLVLIRIVFLLLLLVGTASTFRALTKAKLESKYPGVTLKILRYLLSGLAVGAVAGVGLVRLVFMNLPTY